MVAYIKSVKTKICLLHDFHTKCPWIKIYKQYAVSMMSTDIANMIELLNMRS